MNKINVGWGEARTPTVLVNQQLIVANGIRNLSPDYGLHLFKYILLTASLFTCALFPTTELLAAEKPIQSLQQLTPRFAYAVNSFDDSLSMFTVEPQTGRLIPTGHVTTGHFPSAVGVHPSGRFVYVIAQSEGDIRAFSVNKNTGRLTQIEASPFPTLVNSPFAIVFDPQGKYLYIPGRHSGAVMGFAIDQQTGALSPIPGAPFAAGERPRQIAMHPSGKFVYVVNVHSNNITAYKVNPKNGALSPIPGSPFEPGTAPIVVLIKFSEIVDEKAGATYNLTIDPNGKTLYVANWMSSSVSAFTIDNETGILTTIKGSPFITKPHPYAVTVGPGGNYLYTANWFLHEINGYEIDQQTGALLSSPDLSFSAYGESPMKVVSDWQNNRLYVSNYYTNEINQYDANPTTGALALKDISLARIGPRSFAFLYAELPAKRTSSHAVFLNQKNHNLIVSQIDPINGDLKKIVTIKTQDDPIMAVIDPVPAKIYVANGKQNSVSVFQLDKATGGLHEITGSPFDVGATPDALAIGDNGHYLYVTNKQFKFVNIYAISTKTGELARVPVTPVYVDNIPEKVFIDPLGRYAYVLSKTDDAISALRYDYGAGPLYMEIKDLGSPYAVGGGPVSMATDPVGRFAYVANQKANDVSVFSIHNRSGEIKEIEGSPYRVGKGPVAVAIHPSGKFAYILNKGSGSISVSSRNQRYGTLSKPTHIGTGKNPDGLFIEASGKYLYVSFAVSGEIKKYEIDQKLGNLTQKGSTNMGKGSKLTGLLLNIE